MDADVVSINVNNVVNGLVVNLPIPHFETPANITMGLYEQIKDEKNDSRVLFECRFWNYLNNSWSTLGINTYILNDHVICETNHFTDFAAFALLSDEEYIKIQDTWVNKVKEEYKF